MRAIHCTRVSPDVIFLTPYGSNEVYLTLFSHNKDEINLYFAGIVTCGLFIHTWQLVLA